nr:MAG TPA: hypothetical protein [Caudoviricetes sp.]
MRYFVTYAVLVQRIDSPLADEIKGISYVVERFRERSARCFILFSE